MVRAALIALAACGAPARAVVATPPPTTVPPLVAEVTYVMPAPACPAPEIDPATRRKIMYEANERWNQTHDRNFRDYSAITADLPPLSARWEDRRSVPYRGVVTVYMDVVRTTGSRGGPLVLSLVETGANSAGRYERFELLPSSEPPIAGASTSFQPLWVEPATGRSLGPIHAAISVRPHSEWPYQKDRQQVVIYNPRDRPDILLVARKQYFDSVWTPMLRVDLPKATRFSVYERPPSH